MKLLRERNPRRRIPGIALGLACALGALPAWSQPPEKGTRYFVHGQRGDVALVADYRGQVISTLAHTPYGSRSQERGIDPGSVTRDWGGHARDEATGLVYMGARYYDPSLARFVSIDPAHQGSSAYAALAGAPLEHVDPDGRSWRSGFVEREALPGLARTGAAALVGMGIGAALPAGNGRQRVRNLWIGMAAGAAAGATLSVAVTTKRWLTIARRPVRGKYPIVAFPRVTSGEVHITNVEMLAVVDHFGMPKAIADRHLIYYDQIPAMERPRTWNGHFVLVGHGNNEYLTMKVAQGHGASAMLLGAYAGSTEGLIGIVGGREIDVQQSGIRTLLRQFDGYREICHVDLLSCGIGGFFQEHLHRLLARDRLNVSVRATDRIVEVFPRIASRDEESPSIKVLKSIGEILGIPHSGGEILPLDPRAQSGSWRVFPPPS